MNLIIIFFLVQPVLSVILSLPKAVSSSEKQISFLKNSIFLAYTACNKKYCADHFACSICEKKMNEKSKFFDVDATPVCKQCYGKFPSNIRKSLEQQQKKKQLSSILKQTSV